jgi:hypothetical protein
MMRKKILRPDRLRQVPAPFSWIDQRLVRENFLRHADPAAWSLSLAQVSHDPHQTVVNRASHFSGTTKSPRFPQPAWSAEALPSLL